MSRSYCIIIIVFIFKFSISFSQNLVPNPSFELLKKAPCTAVFSNKTDNLGNYAHNWVAPTMGTSDIQLNTPISVSCTSDLSKVMKKSRTGQTCAGIFTLGVSPRLSAMNGITPYREYLQVKLINKLTAGKIYYVEFYASPIDVTIGPGLSLYNNNIGCYVSADSIHKVSENIAEEFGVFNVVPQINESRVMDNPSQWYKISGCFQATEAAQYLTIGNFYTDAQTKYIEVNRQGFGAYYLIDDVSLIETSLQALPELTLTDRALCPGNSLVINLPESTSISYYWQDGKTGNDYVVTKTGLYSVTSTAGPCAVTDSFRVSQEGLLRLPADTVLCKGLMYSIQPVEKLSSTLTWQNGVNSSQYDVSTDGVYWVRSETPGCIQTDSIRVSFVDCPGNIPNVFTPNGDGINDAFTISGLELLPWHLAVYNRWGRKVFESEQYKNDWNGSGLPSGVYYYSLSNIDVKKTFRGWVEIIRQ